VPTIPKEYTAAMDERYRESERRMRELAGKQQALQSRALRSQGAQRGFTGARNAGAELSVLGSIGAQTSAEVIQKNRELESQRLAEMNKWMEGERGYEQQRGLAEQGFGFQAKLAKDKDDRAAELQREGWTRSEAEAQAERELKQTMQQSEFGQEKTMQDMIADLEREGWGAEEARNEAQRLWQSGESGLERDQETFIQAEEARLTREGWSAEAARDEAQRLWQTEESGKSRTHDVTMQDMVASLEREGFTHDEAMKKAAIDWEREQMYGVGADEQGQGGTGGTYALEQRKVQLEEDRMAQEADLIAKGWDRDDARAQADRDFNKALQEAEQGYFDEDTGEYVGGTEAHMAQVNADMATQLEEFRANQGQIAGALAQFADAMNMRMQGLTDIGRHNQTVDMLNEQLAALGYTGAPLTHWEAAKYNADGSVKGGAGGGNPGYVDPGDGSKTRTPK